MAGLAPISLQQFTFRGAVLSGGKAHFTEADSLEPISVYKDYSLGIEHPNPVEADGNGIFPAIFLDENDQFYRLRVTTAGGTVVFGSDLPVLPVIGPVEPEGGAEVPVDPNSLFQTGDIKPRLGSGVHSGWVRLNGRTIGAAASGASERANADTEALYTLLWENLIDAIAPVTGGRGANAAADFAANKAIGLPDFRSCTIAGLDDMGNSAAGRFTTTVFSTSGQGPTILGALAGAEKITLTEAQLPSLTKSLVGSPLAAHGHPHRVSSATGAVTMDGQGGMVLDDNFADNYDAFTGTPANNRGRQIGGASAGTPEGTISFGSGNSHSNTQPTRLVTIYVRL